MGYNIANGDTNFFIKQNMTARCFAEILADVLRSKGIDVIDGLDAAACEGRYPLSYFALEREGKELFIASKKDKAIDYIVGASKERYPDKYFLLSDGGEAASGASSDGNVEEVMCVSRKSNGSEARIGVYYIEPGSDVVKYSGEMTYEPWTGRLSYHREEGTNPNIYPEFYNYSNEKKIRFHLFDSTLRYGDFGYTDDSLTPGIYEKTDLSMMIRKSVNLPNNTTGARLTFPYDFSITVPQLPDPTFVADFEDRLVYRQSEEDGNRWNTPKFGDKTELEPLSEEQIEEAKPLLDSLLDKSIKAMSSPREGRNSWRRRHSSEGLHAVYVLYVSPAPKGCRMPVGHILIGVSDVAHREYAELAICRLSAKFEINDIYIRTSFRGENGFAFRRCQERTMTSIKEMIGDPQIIKGTIGNARNLKNRYAANAAMGANPEDGERAITVSELKKIASLKFGAEFVEWAYRLGYSKLADRVCEKINSRSAWNRITSMSDIIPGYTEGAKSIFTCFGLPKAWGKTVIDVCIAEKGKDFDLDDLAEGIAATRLAWDLEWAATEGEPSEAAIPKRASDYASIWKGYVRDFGLCNGFDTEHWLYGAETDHWLFAAFPGDPIGLADAFRSYHRMVTKAKRMSNDLYQRQNENYLKETFQAYCTLKRIGEDPKALGVLYEYGLPENDPKAVAEMIRRRTEAAQAVVHSFQDRIDAQARAKLEERLAEQNEKKRWLECSDPEVCKEYTFKLPTSIYGLDKPLSIEYEGEHQRNCVFNAYPRKLASGEYTVILMRRRAFPDSSYVTIGINKSGVVDQTYGHRDSMIRSEAASAIIKWMNKVNSRGKGNLSFRGAPGGWNHAVETIAAE